MSKSPTRGGKRKVDRRGVLHLPKDVTEQHGYRPGEWVDLQDVRLRKAGHTRRAFVRFLFGGAAAALIGAVANLEDLTALYQRLTEFDPDADLKLLTRLFGVAPNGAVSLIPAANHPFRPPPPTPGWYPIEGACCLAYKRRFLGHARSRTVHGYPQLRADDSLIVFGSQVSNLLAREFLGNPWVAGRSLFDLRHSGWSTRLHWNLSCPAHAEITRRWQYGDVWESRNNLLIGQAGETYELPVRDPFPGRDYLLVTSLPRYATGSSRVVLFAGLRGLGTLAAGRLLASPSTEELQRVERAIAYEPYYQALFAVETRPGPDGAAIPQTVELINAAPLVVHGR